MSELYRIETVSGEDFALIKVKGEIDISNADEFAANTLKTFETRKDAAILDISDLEYLDSAAMHVLFELARRLRIQDRPFRLVLPAKAKTYRVLEMTGFHKAAEIFENVEAAISSVNSNSSSLRTD